MNNLQLTTKDVPDDQVSAQLAQPAQQMNGVPLVVDVTSITRTAVQVSWNT